MNHSDDELRQAVGLFRYGLIADLAHLPPGTPGIGERLREKANHAYAIPGTRRTRVAAETIRDWLALYRGGGFEALYPKARVDRGRPRRLPPDIAELLVGLKTEQPSLSVNALIGAARERGVERALAPSTVHRLLSREGLLDKRPGEPVAIDRRRFAFRYAGELWMSDVMHGPKVSDGRRRRKTFLMAFIDDATRVLPFAAHRLLREHHRVPAGAQERTHPPGTSVETLRRQRCQLPLAPARPRVRQARHRAHSRSPLAASGKGENRALLQDASRRLARTPRRRCHLEPRGAHPHRTCRTMFVVSTRRREFRDSSFLRTHARPHAGLESPRARVPYTAGHRRMRIAPGDTAAHGCARQILQPFPRRLRPPPFERRSTELVRRGPSPPHHASADFASVHSASRRSANAHGLTVDPICTIATRDSHYHRVSCPCAKYHHVPTRHRVALGFREDFATGARPQDGMTQAAQSRVFVDGNNVMGSRPDGWWRDRAEAARRLVAEIIPLTIRHGGAWTIVFDGKELPAMPPSPECLTVIHTGHRRRDGADDRIVELVHQQPDRAASLVYTSDAKLRNRVKALGTQVMGSRTLLRQIATVSGPKEPIATGHSYAPADDAGRDHRVNGDIPATPTAEARNRERLW